MVLVLATAVAGLTGCAAAEAPTADVGECLQISELGDEVSSLPVVDCAQPHESEVYAVFNVDVAGVYDETAVIEAAEEGCRTEFADFVGRRYDSSVLDIFYLYPLADGWELGDRKVMCSIFEPSAEDGTPTLVEGTLSGADR
jgi:hypothetical protein